MNLPQGSSPVPVALAILLVAALIGASLMGSAIVLGLAMGAGLGLALIGLLRRAAGQDSPARLAERLHALRILATYFIAWILIQVALMLISAVVFGIDMQAMTGDQFFEEGAAASGTAALAALLSVWLVWRRGGPSPDELGLGIGRGFLPDILVGLAVGPLAFILITIVLLAGQWLTFSGSIHTDLQGLRSIVVAILVFSMVSVSEEVSIRGYLLQCTARIGGMPAAAILTSLFWGLAHLGNPHASLLGSVNIALSGFVFAQAYIVTRSLWLPMAFHFSWNVAEGPLFGYPVSGLTTASILSPILHGPVWITGGDFGPEASLISLGGVALAAVIFWVYGRIRPRWLCSR